MVDNWYGYIWLVANTKEPQTEINQQFKLVNDYRKLVENIKVKHSNTFKQIEDELQPKNVQQHQNEIHVRSKLRSTNLTANGSFNVPVENSQGMLNGRGFSKKTQSHEIKCDSWQVGLKKSPEDPLVFQQGESFTQSRKMCSKLINPKGKIEKLFTNDDIKVKCFNAKNIIIKPQS